MDFQAAVGPSLAGNQTRYCKENHKQTILLFRKLPLHPLQQKLKPDLLPWSVVLIAQTRKPPTVMSNCPNLLHLSLPPPCAFLKDLEERSFVQDLSWLFPALISHAPGGSHPRPHDGKELGGNPAPK